MADDLVNVRAELLAACEAQAVAMGSMLAILMEEGAIGDETVDACIRDIEARASLYGEINPDVAPYLAEIARQMKFEAPAGPGVFP